MLKVQAFLANKLGEVANGVLEGLQDDGVIQFAHGGEQPDLVFSVCWPSRISQILIKHTRLGGVNIHTSLLPEGRGSHPLNWALIWGQEKTGITIHKIVDTYDAGDIVLQEEIPIFFTDDILALRARVEARFPNVIRTFFEDVEGHLANARQQNQALASYAQKRRPEDSELNLDAHPLHTYNLFRSCDPDEYPAFVIQDGKKVIVKRFDWKDRSYWDYNNADIEYAN
jgi:methionyl-tRNA formyltransferase